MNPRKRLMLRRRVAVRRAAEAAGAQPVVVEAEPADAEEVVEEVVKKTPVVVEEVVKKTPVAKTPKAPAKKARKRTTQKK